MLTIPLEISPFSYQFFLLSIVIFLKAIVMRFSNTDPLEYFRFYCDLLAKKVNKASNGKLQQTIAGGLALSISLLVPTIILWLFADFIEVLWLWHALLLYLALGSLNLNKKAVLVAQNLIANKNYQAKQTLKPLVLRECDNLSSMGLSKTFIEMQLLRTTQQVIVTAFYFLAFGPLAALSYRLLLEMHYSWNIKQPTFDAFGRIITLIINVLQWLPIRLFSLLILLTSINQPTLLFWRLVKKQFFQLNNDFLLHCFALRNEIKLGGVAIYQGKKLRKISFNDNAKQPAASDIVNASQRLTFLLSLVFLITSALALASFVSYN